MRRLPVPTPGYFQANNSYDPPVISQHIFYIDASNHVHELAQVNTNVFIEPWTHNDIFQMAANNPSNSSPIVSPTAGTALAAYVANDNSQHVIYIGDDSHVHELRYDAQNGWKHNDLIQLVPYHPGPDSAPGGALIGYVRSGISNDPLASYQYIHYVDVENHVYELQWQPPGWSIPSAWYDFDVIFQAANNPYHPENNPVPNVMPGSALAGHGYASGPGGSALNIIYIGVDSHVHQLYFDAEQWGHTDITQAATPNSVPDVTQGSPLASSPVPNWAGEVIDYIDADSHVEQFYWNPTYGWSKTDLSNKQIPGAGAAGTGSGLSVAFLMLDGQSDPSVHAFYVGSTGYLQDLWWSTNNPDAVQLTDLTLAATATVPIPRSALATYVGPAW